jgi:hypothetical protein
VPSVSRHRFGALLVLAAAGPLAGCSTTMQQAGRLRLDSARIRASERVTRITPSPDPVVTVTGVGAVSAAGRTAVLVSARNLTRRTVDDLPISVGFKRGRRLVYLNAAAGIAYFQTHLPAIAAGRTLTWVYLSRHRLPRGARLFAYVGRVAAPPAPAAGGLPMIRIVRNHGRATLTVRNESGIPQYQLPVYAYARRGGRYVAAAASSIAELGGQASRRLNLSLIGSAGQSGLEFEALPTILR